MSYLFEFQDTRTPLNKWDRNPYITTRNEKKRKIYIKFTYFNSADCAPPTRLSTKISLV